MGDAVTVDPELQWHPTIGPRREYEVGDLTVVTDFSTPDHVLYLLLGSALALAQTVEFKAGHLAGLLTGKPIAATEADRRTLGQKANDFVDLLPEDLPEAYREVVRRRNYLVHEILRDHEWSGNLLITGPETYRTLYERIGEDTGFIRDVQRRIDEHLAKRGDQMMFRQGRESMEVFDPESDAWVPVDKPEG